MRARLVAVLGVVAALVACDRSAPVAPTPSDEVVDLVPDYALSPAASVDGAGIGAALLPEELRLSAEQKAAIAMLHDAFMKATAADVAALRAIEREARDAKAAGKSREEIRHILARGLPIRERLDAAFKRLQAEIWAVYTPEQRAWIESHRPRGCGPATVRLTQEQVQQIRALQERFMAAVTPDLELIRSIVAEARAAREAGQSREAVARILARAADPQRRVRAAERALHDAIMALLTPEQRQRWQCRANARP
jgi:Spy/CpxP family protein refolding chaperone